MGMLLLKIGLCSKPIAAGRLRDYIELNIGLAGIIENWLPDADLSDFEGDE